MVLWVVGFLSFFIRIFLIMLMRSGRWFLKVVILVSGGSGGKVLGLSLIFRWMVVCWGLVWVRRRSWLRGVFLVRDLWLIDRVESWSWEGLGRSLLG